MFQTIADRLDSAQCLQKSPPKELFDRIREAANDPYFELPDPRKLPTWSGATGEQVKDSPLLRMIRVSRRRMRAICARRIEVEVRICLCFPQNLVIDPECS